MTTMLNQLKDRCHDLWHHTLLLETHACNGYKNYRFAELAEHIGKPIHDIPANLQENIPAFVIDTFLAHIVANNIGYRVSEKLPIQLFIETLPININSSVPSISVCLAILNFKQDVSYRQQRPYYADLLSCACFGNLPANERGIYFAEQILTDLKEAGSDFDCRELFDLDELLERLDYGHIKGAGYFSQKKLQAEKTADRTKLKAQNDLILAGVVHFCDKHNYPLKANYLTALCDICQKHLVYP